jgi:hypothetical protein
MAPRHACLTASLPPRRRGACREAACSGSDSGSGSGPADHAPLDPQVLTQAAFEVAR